jgi:hypothetical protein
MQGRTPGGHPGAGRTSTGGTTGLVQVADHVELWVVGRRLARLYDVDGPGSRVQLIGGHEFELLDRRVRRLRWTLDAAVRLLAGRQLAHLLAPRFVVVRGHHEFGPWPGMRDLSLVEVLDEHSEVPWAVVCASVFAASHVST